MGRGGIIVGRYCHPSSVVEQCFRKAQVVGSSPMGGFLFATGGALRAAPVASFQPPSASPLATRARSADWIGRTSWSSRLVPPRPGRVGSRVESHGWLSRGLPRPRRCATLAWGAVGVGGRSGAERSGGERSGGLLGMTHAPEVLGHRGSVGVCVGRSQWGIV